MGSGFTRRIDWSSPVLGIGLMLVMLAVIFAAAALVSVARCASLCERSGLKTHWGVVDGCYIEAEPGRMVPVKNWRVE